MVCRSGDCVESDCVQLTERESSVCNVICSSEQPVSFGQLKDSTNLHQEILSRIIHRLVIHGVVRKADGRYKGECGQ